MDKELLEALEKLKLYWNNKLPLSRSQGLKIVSIIETAIERLQQLEEEKQSFDRVIEKKLKALEIIINKQVNVQEFISCLDLDWTYELCEKYCQDNNEWEEHPPYKHSMTKEEYDLLKEVLKKI